MHRVSAGSQASDPPLARIQRLPAPRVRVLRPVNQQRDTLEAHAGLHHPRLAVEVLFQIDETAKVGFKGRCVATELGSEGAVGLFLAEPVLGARSDELHVVGCAGFHQPVPEMVLHLDRMMEFPAKFSRIGHARGKRRAHAEFDLSQREPREPGV